MYFYNDGRAVYAPGQVADLSLTHILHLMQSLPTTATLKSPVNRLPPHPQLQCLGLFVQLVTVYSIPGPSQNRRPLFVCQMLSLAENAGSPKYQAFSAVSRIPAESQKMDH